MAADVPLLRSLLFVPGDQPQMQKQVIAAYEAAPRGVIMVKGRMVNAPG